MRTYVSPFCVLVVTDESLRPCASRTCFTWSVLGVPFLKWISHTVPPV